MTSHDQIAAATGYEELLVPALTREWAARVLDAAALGRGERVLDVACGTGVVARGAAARLGDSGAVVGVDPDPGMLAVAERLAPCVAWRQGVAESLPVSDASFDIVLSQFGLMFFHDRSAALREMLRVLTPAGRVVIAVWDALERCPAYAQEVALLERLAGPAAAQAMRRPFCLGDPAELLDLCKDAGFSALDVTTQTGTARFPSIRTMVEADLRGWLPVMGVVLGEAQIREILVAAEQALSDHIADQGTVVFQVSAHIVTGQKI